MAISIGVSDNMNGKLGLKLVFDKYVGSKGALFTFLHRNEHAQCEIQASSWPHLHVFSLTEKITSLSFLAYCNLLNATLLNPLLSSSPHFRLSNFQATLFACSAFHVSYFFALFSLQKVELWEKGESRNTVGRIRRNKKCFLKGEKWREKELLKGPFIFLLTW